MTARFQVWLTQQPLPVKLLIVLPAVALALLWATDPGGSRQSESHSSGNRAVLSREDRGAVGLAQAGPSGNSAEGTPQDAPVVSSTGVAVQSVQPSLMPHREPQTAELSWAIVVRTLVSVGLVIGLIILSARSLKLVVARAGLPAATGTQIKVVETMFLPSPSGRGRAAMHLIEIGDRLLLVGATDASLTLLTELDRDEPLEAPSMPVAGVPSSNGNASFTHALELADQAAHHQNHTSTFHVDPEIEEVLRRLRDTRRRLEG
jgi:flagellar biogenesis protein FliO